MANALKQACITVDLGHKHEVQPHIKHADITSTPTTVKVSRSVKAIHGLAICGLIRIRELDSYTYWVLAIQETSTFSSIEKMYISN